MSRVSQAMCRSSYPEFESPPPLECDTGVALCFALALLAGGSSCTICSPGSYSNSRGMLVWGELRKYCRYWPEKMYYVHYLSDWCILKFERYLSHGKCAKLSILAICSEFLSPLQKIFPFQISNPKEQHYQTPGATFFKLKFFFFNLHGDETQTEKDGQVVSRGPSLPNQSIISIE